MPASAYPGSPYGIKVVLLGGVLSSCVPLKEDACWPSIITRAPSPAAITAHPSRVVDMDVCGWQLRVAGRNFIAPQTEGESAVEYDTYATADRGDQDEAAYSSTASAWMCSMRASSPLPRVNFSGGLRPPATAFAVPSKKAPPWSGLLSDLSSG